MPPLTTQADRQELIERRHPEQVEFEYRWSWQQDTYEGGDRYRKADYGLDWAGMPAKNLVRYKHDYPTASERTQESQIGNDPQAYAASSDFEMRLARTPPPNYLEEAIGIHLSKLFKTDPQRKGPKALEAWWQDVDGKGTSATEWFRDTIAALYCSNAQVDLCFDHPQLPDGEIVNTRADEIRLGLSKCIANFILPQNMLWWRLDNQGRYIECLVKEPQEDGSIYYRHWTPTDWTLYEEQADEEANDTRIEVVDQGVHKYGRPPIERVLFRKRVRCTHVGVNLYESICELSRAVYNLESELVLSDSTQAHPTLQAPADLIGAGDIKIGPSGVLSMLKCEGQDGQIQFQGYEYVDPPKGAADSIRANIQRHRDEIDRIACLTKPAGAQGTTGATVAQSGLSKVMDQSTGNDLLSKLSGCLQRLERVAATLALLVLGDGKVDPADIEAIEISYPKTFELADTVGLTQTIEGYQSIMGSVGATPKTETELVKRFIRVALPGRDEKVYEDLDEENAEFIESKAKTFEQDQEAAQAMSQSPNQPKPAAQGGTADDIVEEDEEPNG